MVPATNNSRAGEILRFWFGDDAQYGKARPQWFRKDPAFDRQIRERFLDLHEEAAAGRLARWIERPADALALVLLLDQFPRNLFRDSARAFACDRLARETAREAIERGYDVGRMPVERLFFYLPFEHSEALEDQAFACRLMETLAAFPETADVYAYALRHREIIERFGRFPHRNAALGRASTPQESEFLKLPGSGF